MKMFPLLFLFIASLALGAGPVDYGPQFQSQLQTPLGVQYDARDRNWLLAATTDSILLADLAPANQTITAFDSSSTSLVGANGQVFYFGTPTVGSAANYALSGQATIAVQANILGSGGTLVVEASSDGGTAWFRPSVNQTSTQFYTNGFTLPFQATLSVAGFTNIRVRAVTSWTGTGTIIVRESQHTRNVIVSEALPTGTNSIGQVTANAGTNLNTSALALSATQTNGTQKTQIVDGSNVNQGTVTNPFHSQADIPLTANAATSVSVGVASGAVVAVNASRNGLIIMNLSANTVSLGLTGAAVLNTGITLYPGGIWTMDQYSFTTAAITGIASGASSTVSVQEFQ